MAKDLADPLADLSIRHYPAPAQLREHFLGHGFRTPAHGRKPQLGMLVHTLEHGRIDIQYKKGTPAQTISQLETLYKSLDDGHHMLLFQNPTNMPFAVAATAWDNQLGCPTMNDKVFDAIRTFRESHIDQGPEIVP